MGFGDVIDNDTEEDEEDSKPEFEKSGEDIPSDTDRKYVEITKEQFEEFLDKAVDEWKLVGEAENEFARNFTREYVYDIPVLWTDELCIRIYSTIDSRTNVSRDKGEDSIKNVIWSYEYNRPVGGQKKTLRIKTWRDNLYKKIDRLQEQWADVVNDCDECDGWMVVREGKHGEFLGCLNYPDCENTRQIED